MREDLREPQGALQVPPLRYPGVLMALLLFERLVVGRGIFRHGRRGLTRLGFSRSRCGG
jgi:hypothetical protein